MNDQIKALSQAVTEAKDKLRQAIAEAPPEKVDDWELTALDGSKTRLSSLFGDQTELLVVHNMGRGCNYCSLWADGLIGYADHLQERCGFALCSNDPPEVAKAFASERGWDYPVVSGHGSEFAKSMGYADEKGSPWPGVSAFHKNEDGTIVRTGDQPFGPGDDFCAVWPMLDLIKGNKGEWEPRKGGKSSCCSPSGCCS